MKQPLFIDTDMGVDDIIAIGLIFLSGNYSICGISVVNGVSSVQKGAKNLARLLEALNSKIPIFQGVSQREQRSSVQFSSRDRMRAKNLTLIKSVTLPKPSISAQNIKRTESIFRRAKKPLIVFCIGPLSNISIFLKKECIMKKIKRLVIMGGAIYTKGNVKPSYESEYNIRLDPQSANKVLASPLPKLLIPMDATFWVPAVLLPSTKTTPACIAFLRWLKTYTPPTIAGKIIRDIILNNSDDFSSFYDPLAAAVLVDPSIITKQINGDIRVSKKKQIYGKLLFSPRKRSVNIIVLKPQPEKFYALLKKLLQKDNNG